MTAPTANPPFRSLLPGAEVALALVTLSAVYGLNRLFVDASHLPSLFWFVVGSHTLAAVCRRQGWSLAVSAAVSIVGFAFVTGWVLYADTTGYGIPTGATLDAARTDLSMVWTLFQQVVAPAPVEKAFILAAAIAVWTCGYVGDWAAFRLWIPFESVVPAATMFVFGSLLGAPEHRTDATIVFLGAVIGFVLLHRVARQQTSSSWLTSDVSRGSAALLKAGGGLGLIAVLLGAAGGPLLPGADATAVVPWRNFDTGPGSRQTVSPLVQIHGRLVEQTDLEMFTVRSTHRAYWRLTSLDTFDGNVWSSKGSYGQESGELSDPEQFDAAIAKIHQHYEIEGLAAIWLPAAFEARAIDIPDAKVRWERESATLIVDTTFEDSDGLTYDIDSQSPRLDADTLLAAGANPEVPDDILERYLALPDSLSSDVQILAADVTRDAGSTYGQALALQSFFRDNFEYSLEVQPGHGESAIEDFLFNRIGYCEQFAGTFAAMARSIGLPARVAVGFTPGDVDRTQPDLYHVRGKHAHAWPEVYIGSVGWVAFEPTPGRGIPAGEGYTGVPEQQVDSGNTSTATTLPNAVDDGGVGTPTTTDTGSLPTTPPDAPDTGDLATGAAGDRDSWGVRMWNRWGGRVLWTLASILMAAVLYLVGVPLARILRRRRRRDRAEEPVDQVRVAWDESVEAMAVIGVSPRASETLSEFAVRAGRHVDGDTYPALATTLEEAEYSDIGVTNDDSLRALELSEHIQRTVQRKATREQRVKAALDPRPLLPRLTSRRRVRYAEGSPEHVRDRVRAGV